MFLLFALGPAAAVADGPRAPFVGRSVAEVIDEFRTAGENFAYSTNLVTADLRVLAEPSGKDAVAVVREILAPHGLDIRTDAGVHLVVPAVTSKPAPTSAPAPASPDAGPEIETVVVAASRYEISRDLAPSQFVMDQRTIQNMPDIGEDPLRVAQRLPGAAASGASAMAHFRGGEQNEIGIMLNGQWLFDPFHVRDYQSIFSAIDARAIEGVEVYTGGFPVRFGDRMSGVVLMDSIDASKPRHNELGISVYNTSLLTAGREGSRSWLFSARRGNLDLVIDPQFGRPKYYDAFAEFSIELSSSTRVSMNALFADDEVEVVLESDPAEREQIVSDTRNAQVWLSLDSAWSPTLSSTTLLSMVDYDKRREGLTADPGKMIAAVRDERDVRIFGIRQEWAWSPSDHHRMQWGIDVEYGEADYNYRASAEYFELQAMYPGQPSAVTRMLAAQPQGASYAVYFSDRWRLSAQSMLEWGLRWDDQTYTELGSDAQLSPRLSILRRLGSDTELRLSAGRYHQSQALQSLQIEDGITSFWPAQRADQYIAGLRHRAARGLALRLEMFHKAIRDVRPRFENLYDPLGTMPELQPDRVRLDPERGSARGVELSADQAVGAWHWWASYTWAKVTDRIDGRDVPRSWDQRHAVQAGVHWRGEAWDFSAATSIHSGWPRSGDLELTTEGFDDDGEPVTVAVPGERNALRHPPFASLDLRLSRRFNVPRGSLLAFVEISNALNRRNVCCIDWDIEEDASGNEVLEYSRDYWMPLLPAIGILWEF